MNPRLHIDTTETGISEIGLGVEGKTVDSQNKVQGALARRWERAARKELQAYFAGRLRKFSVPCDLNLLPPFTRAVLRITSQIPYGDVRTYQWVAKRLGKPGASRAVGNALARNPIPFVIPCHRVVRSDGTPGGFSLGLSWKKKLQGLERSLSKFRKRSSK